MSVTTLNYGSMQWSGRDGTGWGRKENDMKNKVIVEPSFGTVWLANGNGNAQKCLWMRKSCWGSDLNGTARFVGMGGAWELWEVIYLS